PVSEMRPPKIQASKAMLELPAASSTRPGFTKTPEPTTQPMTTEMAEKRVSFLTFFIRRKITLSSDKRGSFFNLNTEEGNNYSLSQNQSGWNEVMRSVY